jgi:hypothetical protein
MSCVVAACDELGSGFESGHGRLAVDSNLGMGGGVRFWQVVSGWTWRWVFAWEVAACFGVGSGLGGDGRLEVFVFSFEVE